VLAGIRLPRPPSTGGSGIGQLSIQIIGRIGRPARDVKSGPANPGAQTIAVYILAAPQYERDHCRDERMTRFGLILFCALPLSAVPAAADNLVEPGQWKVTSSTVMNGASSPPQVKARCLTPEQAGDIARFAEGAVVGSAIVAKIESHAAKGSKRAELVGDVIEFCAALAKSVHAAVRDSVVG